MEEGNVFRLFQTEVDGTQAVHRFFNTETGFHHYSTDINEIENFEASSSYTSEGIVGYGGVVDTREAEQLASQQSTIIVSNRFDTVETEISGSFNLPVSIVMDFGGANGFNGSVTAMSSTGEELPEYLNFNERSGQIYGYTLKDGTGDNNILVLADDGISQNSRNFVLSASDSNLKADADAYTEKSLIASMSVNSNSVGGSFVPTIATSANLTCLLYTSDAADE